GLKEEDDIPTDWLHSYFSDSQAVDMYKDINKHFRGKVIKGNQNDDWRIQNASILDSLIQFY
ncbi:MAG: hypothetical protein HKO66_03070, partial [Saprospiraceae bacterium]|nr:hypothetical protein [Saprospiraceae bacterium]